MCPNQKSPDYTQLISGIRTLYDTTSNDRTFAFECCNLATASGKKVTVLQVTNDGKIWTPWCTAPQAPDTRLASFQCPPAGTNSGINQVGGILCGTCPSGTLLWQIQSNYFSKGASGETGSATYGDRVFSFQCCNFDTHQWTFQEIQAYVQQQGGQ
jgi:hypothetical protein